METPNNLSYFQNRSVSSCIQLLSRAFRGKFVVPEFGYFCKQITELYHECKSNGGGQVKLKKNIYFKSAGSFSLLFRTKGTMILGMAIQAWFAEEKNILRISICIKYFPARLEFRVYDRSMVWLKKFVKTIFCLLAVLSYLCVQVCKKGFLCSCPVERKVIVFLYFNSKVCCRIPKNVAHGKKITKIILANALLS